MPGSVRSSPRRPASQGSQSQRSVRSSPRVMTSPSRTQGNEQSNGRDGGGDFIVEPSDPLSQSLMPTSPYRSGNDLISSPLNYGTPSSMSLRTPRSVNRATPMRPRIDLGLERNLRQIPLTSEGDAPDQPTLVIWGTDVVFSRCKTKFKNFIENFEGYSIEDHEAVEEGSEPKKIYFEVLNKLHLLEQQYININCAHLQKFDDELYKKLVAYPQEVIPAFDMSINELFFSLHPDAVLPQQIQIRPFNVETIKSMRNLDPEDIDRLVTINGMVIRSSNIIPDMRVAFFLCSVCNFSTSVEIDRGRIAEPTLCGRCKTSYSFTMVHNRSTFTDKQLVKLQESPDEMPAGQTPHTVTLISRGDLVDSVNPGQRVSVTGIYRAVPIQVNPRMRLVRSIYKTHIDVLFYSTSDSKRLFDQSNKPHEFQPARLGLLKALSQRPDLYERLANSIAPSIFENEDIKKGILLQLFGGTRKVHEVTGRNTFRSEINVLLCGDPGTSKSQLLSYVYNLVPKSQYTSGKGSSAVGLTAYVTKDPETRQLVLQTGALVLADNGVCCIDEFDKMNESTRSVLHEVMEQQTLSIAKAGIICQLSARTSVLAAANPVGSEWDKNKTIIDNIRLPHTLLSRFDLIFLMLDPQSEIYDRKLAKHLVSLYHKKREFDEAEELDSTILRDYITYARESIHPTLSEAASNSLINAYVEMRKVGRGRGQISAYPRQLESLIRLSEAHAKMRMSTIVEQKDVDEARRLHREALKQSAVDPLTGKLDVSILTTGLSMAARKKKLDVREAVMNFLKKKAPGSTMAYQRLLKDLKEEAATMVTRDVFDQVLKDLQEEGVVSLSSKFTVKILLDRSAPPT